MKHTKAPLSALLLLCAVCAISETSDEYTYAILPWDIGIRFDSCAGMEPDAVLPDGIDGQAVTYLGQDFFKDNKTVHSATLPNGLKSIDYQVFAYCTAMENVVIPDSVTSIKTDGYATSGACSADAYEAVTTYDLKQYAPK